MPVYRGATSITVVHTHTHTRLIMKDRLLFDSVVAIVLVVCACSRPTYYTMK